jgi:CheY-like chemotaxis protein
MKTVLVVEDSRSQRECLLNQLHWRGINAIAAVDGVEALERLQSQCPDLVLLDMVMPRIDGYGACRLIKANPATCHLPVVLLTGKGKQTALERGIKYADAYVGKPWRSQELLQTIRHVLLNVRPCGDRVSAQAWTDYGLLILNTLELYEGRISDRAKYLATVLKLYHYAIAAFEQALELEPQNATATHYRNRSWHIREELEQKLGQNKPCPSCWYYHGKQGINCAIHPAGRPSLECYDWELER